MGPIKTIAIVVLSISSVLFIALFGRLPIFRRTPIGFLHRLIWIHIPNLLYAIDLRLTSGRLSRSLNRTGDYLMNEANPVVLIFFLLLQSISQGLFIPSAWSLTSTKHRILMPILSFFPYYTLYLCATTSSNISPDTAAPPIHAYPYDHALFYPGQICRTCKVPKPARSKHCSLCGSCIQKQDHHCVWINNCVGRNNHAHFLLLLLSISVLLAYGALLGFSLLDQILQAHFVPARLTAGSVTSKRWSTRLSWLEYANMLLVAVSWNWQVGAVTMLSFLSFPLSTGFLGYHIYLLWAGMTTNESSKWADWREDIADGYAFRAKIEDVRDDYPRLSQDLEPVLTWPGGEGKWFVIRTRGGRWPTRKRSGPKTTTTGQRMEEEEEEEEEGGGGGDEEEDDTRWQRVHDLSELENIYDLGFWDNVKDVLVNRD